MTNTTQSAESQARYAIAYGSRDDLRTDEARAAYDRLQGQPIPAGAPRRTGSNPPARTYEERMEDNARQARIAVQVIAWVVCIFAVLAVIGGIIEAITLHSALVAHALYGQVPGS